MALVLEFQCSKCETTVIEVSNHNRICFACRIKAEQKERREFLKKFKDLTKDEMAELIAQELYNLKKAIELCEKKPHYYA